MPAWNRKDLISIYDLEPWEIEHILKTAEYFKKLSDTQTDKNTSLRGKTVVNLFIEVSTRTRTSFELAEQRLGADIINISASTSSLSKGETLLDTAKNIEAMRVDIIVMRHWAVGSHYFVADRVKCGVINAGDGAHEHPTQALLDIFTIKEKKGRIKGLNVTIVGDILHSRVARSNIWGLLKMGANVTITGPATLVPKQFEKIGVKVRRNLKDALLNADVINLLRIQHERQRNALFPSIGEYAYVFGLNDRTMEFVKPDALIMHPGPINRGVELDSKIADGQQSVILEQVTNGLAVRMAVLHLTAGAAKR
jgi:aspartate carbamoyltransferase catalytic subunit